jgi:hypothetical protein
MPVLIISLKIPSRYRFASSGKNLNIMNLFRLAPVQLLHWSRAPSNSPIVNTSAKSAHHQPARDTYWRQNLEQFSMQSLAAKNKGCDLSQSETEIPGASLPFSRCQSVASRMPYWHRYLSTIRFFSFCTNSSDFFPRFRFLILIVVVGVPIRPKMSNCYQFGVIQAVAFGIPPNRLKKGISSMSPLRSGPEKGFVSLFYVRLLLCRYILRVQHCIRVHRP